MGSTLSRAKRIGASVVACVAVTVCLAGCGGSSNNDDTTANKQELAKRGFEDITWADMKDVAYNATFGNGKCRATLIRPSGDVSKNDFGRWRGYVEGEVFYDVTITQIQTNPKLRHCF